jgi:alkaline phosphatase D
MQAKNRRDFIIRIASVSATLSAGGVLASERENEPLEQRNPVRFDYGVASGDPLADRVILWTHARRTAGTSSVQLEWEVALDPAFRKVVAEGEVTARATNDFTAKVDARGLKPGETYYYRFRAGSANSPVGKTRTLPEKNVSSVKLAVFSCANFPAGYFYAYSEAIQTGAQYALHIGDYIYEYPADGYASQDAAALERLSLPANEVITLADYRERYAQYRGDPDLKQLHASMPMIAVYDDHEVANNSYVTGAENHTEGVEGTFAARVAAAMKVYHEWMPIRTPDMQDLRKVYRSFNFGKILSLHMLETRLLARAKQIEVTDLLNPATSAAAVSALSSPNRQLMGEEQLTWLSSNMAASAATWQVLGQQVIMARMEFPASILQALNPANTSPEAQAAGAKAINDYLTAKGIAKYIATNNIPVTALPPAQQALLALLDVRRNPKLGYNLDAWDGYPAAREKVLATAKALQKRLVVLAGDTHNAWHSDLTLLNGSKVGEEFATPGVSSPGLEEYLSIPPAQTAAIFQGVIDTLRYAETQRRGFLLMTFTAESATGEWYFIDNVKSSNPTWELGHTAVMAA